MDIHLSEGKKEIGEVKQEKKRTWYSSASAFDCETSDSTDAPIASAVDDMRSSAHTKKP
jgi:hypothetical protein